MCGFAAAHDRRHDEHIQNARAVAPVMTCSRFTNAVSLHRGHTGIRRTERREDARDLPAFNIFFSEERIEYTARSAWPLVVRRLALREAV